LDIDRRGRASPHIGAAKPLIGHPAKPRLTSRRRSR